MKSLRFALSCVCVATLVAWSHAAPAAESAVKLPPRYAEVVLNVEGMT